MNTGSKYVTLAQGSGQLDAHGQGGTHSLGYLQWIRNLSIRS